MAETAFRNLPSVDRLAADPRVLAELGGLPRHRVVELARAELAAARALVAAGGLAPDYETLVGRLIRRGLGLLVLSLRQVINATGVIIHTNLGRAPLSRAARAAIAAVAAGYSNLEFDLEAGERGHRHTHLEDLLCQVTGAEAGFAVNNNAAAVLLGLTALAQGREVIVSRGQAVEIGGGFRIPDVLRQSGARLVEVGTTNRTYLRDYEAAAGPETAAILRVHRSNFRIVGFTTEPDVAELAGLAHSRGILLLDDLGSGSLIDTTRFGLAKEPLVQESIRAGVDLVFFSGDKLLGGPQAGVIVGRRELVERLRRHPLARAVRIDKLCLAALTATLLHYLKDEALTEIPVWWMIARPADEVRARAVAWAERVAGLADLDIVPVESAVGGGSLPGETLPSFALAVRPRDGDVAGLARRLRLGSPAVVGRVEAGRLLLDPRTVLPEDEADLLTALRQALSG
jgi:L-seryl-tRNA(Ser) seleniumtransferase